VWLAFFNGEIAMKIVLAITMSLFASLACAWEEPDQAFAKYHNAVMTGNADEMLRLMPAARRVEVAPRKDTEVRQQNASMPAAFALEQKTVSRDGQRAKLYYSAPGEAFPTPKAGAQYGIVRLVLEGGEWRVADHSWAREKPVEIVPRSQPGRLRDVTPAGPARPAPLMRVARPDCSYAPVMSDEEINRCR